MIPEELIKFIIEETKMRAHKHRWEDLDPYSQVLLSRNINDGVYSVKFHQTLNNYTLEVLEYDITTNMPYVVNGILTRQACIFVSGEWLIFKVLDNFEYNDSHTFNNLEELRCILKEYNLLK